MSFVCARGISAYNSISTGPRNFEFVLFISSLSDAIEGFNLADATGGDSNQARISAASTTRRKKQNSNSELEEKIKRFYMDLEAKGYAKSQQQQCVFTIVQFK